MGFGTAVDDGEFNPGDEAEPALGEGLAKLRETVHGVVVGNGGDGHAVLVQPLGDLTGRQQTVAERRVAVEVHPGRGVHRKSMIGERTGSRKGGRAAGQVTAGK